MMSEYFHAQKIEEALIIIKDQAVVIQDFDESMDKADWKNQDGVIISGATALLIEESFGKLSRDIQEYSETIEAQAKEIEELKFALRDSIKSLNSHVSMLRDAPLTDNKEIIDNLVDKYLEYARKELAKESEG